MGREIERKFLVKNDAWRGLVQSSAKFQQGYLAIDAGNTVRVRSDGESAWITIKGPAEGVSRAEFEYAVPQAEALELLGLCRGRLVEKIRHKVALGSHVWEIDEFSGDNAGLVLAEVELDDPQEDVGLPDWLGPEVSGDRRFDNASLSAKPYRQWAACSPDR